MAQFSCALKFAPIKNLLSKTIVRRNALDSVRPFSRVAYPRKRIMFLGTPSVAATCLDRLVSASNSSSDFEIVAVTTMPPAPVGRTKKITNSPVHASALALNIPYIFTPIKANEAAYLNAVQDLKLDLCITAAYGNYLPQKFLSLPRLGTVNIHPSLLPKYRGAAPVQRCIQAGDAETGVSVLFSEKEMDAGPILAQQRYILTGRESSAELMDILFAKGVNLLIDELPHIFDGSAVATKQDHTAATEARKIGPMESHVDFNSMTAVNIHSHVRAFLEWPGTVCTFKYNGGAQPPATTGESNFESNWTNINVKILKAEVLDPTVLGNKGISGDISGSGGVHKINLVKVNGLQYLAIPTMDGSVLGISELLPEARKAMDAKSFLNGFKGQPLYV